MTAYNYIELIKDISALAFAEAPAAKILERVSQWATYGGSKMTSPEAPEKVQQPAAPAPQATQAGYPQWLTGLFDKLLPNCDKPTEQDSKSIYEAAKGDTELIAALLELLKWRIDNGRLNTSAKVIGLIIKMLRDNDPEEIKRKGNSIGKNRVAAEKLNQQPAPQPDKPLPPTKPEEKPQPVKPAVDPIEALMSQTGDTPENVAKLQAKLAEWLAKKQQPAPQPEPVTSFDDDPPIYE